MKFPVIVLGYGNFVRNHKLFFYEIGGLGSIPLFTEPTVASTFCASVNERMGELLIGKPPLTTMTCTKRSHLLDILKLISVMTPDVLLVEVNPYPLTDKYRRKLAESKAIVDSQKYELAEFIEMLQNQSE